MTGSASAPSYAQVDVAVDQVAAYINQFPGSFAGTCPAPGTGGGGGGGGAGGTPIATVLVCQVTGSASAPSYAQVDVAVDQVAAYISQFPGSFAGTCPAPGTGGSGGGGGAGGGGNLPGAGVAVCNVAVSGGAFSFVNVNIAVDRLAAYLNQHPGSFAGTCPAGSGTGSGSGSGNSPNGALVVCRVTGGINAPRFAQVAVAVDQLAAYLNRNSGTFVGGCPTTGDPNGNPGLVPAGFLTICRVTGSAATPYAALTVAASRIGVFLNQAGTILPAPAGGCPTSVDSDTSSGNGGGGGSDSGSGSGSGSGSSETGSLSAPSSTTVGTAATVVVKTTPNTVVTARGAGVKGAAKSNKKGRAVIRIKPTKRGLIQVRAAGGKIVKRIGVTSVTTSAKHLTG
ncbi:MAG: hypothetical protein H0T61_03135 [Actinobacteria bacterium]|nr:hypothetical protein [Actinomycetota bacterium]